MAVIALRDFRQRIGVGVGRDSVRVVLVNRRRIEWSAEALLFDNESLSDVLAALLTKTPARRWPRPILNVAVGPSAAQTRLLRDLPPLKDAGTLAALVRANAGRFFLKNGVPLVTTGVALRQAGTAWASAIEKPVCDAILVACRRQGLRVRAVVPTMAVLPFALGLEALRWVDGDVIAEATYDAGGVSTLRRTTIDRSAIPVECKSPESQPLQDARVVQFADAYGAATVAPAETMAWRPGRDGDGEVARSRRRRLLVAGVACIAGFTAAWLTPALSSAKVASDANRYLAAMARERTDATKVERELGLVTESLRSISAFQGRTPSQTLFLASLTRSLPDSTMLVSLRTDSVGGTLVALAPRAAAVINQLEGVFEITTPALAGAVTPEPGVGDRTMERAAIRFRWRASSPALRASRTGTR
jgi:hypothetical protein